MANILPVNSLWRQTYKNIFGTFGLFSEVAFSCLNLSVQKDIGFLSCRYSQLNYCNNSKNSWIIQSCLFGNSSCRNLRLKKPNNPKSVFIRDII